MLLVEKLFSETLRKRNRVLDSETSYPSSDHPNFSFPFCTKIFDEKDEVVEHLDTCNGTEDLSATTLLSVIKKLRTILTTATSLMIPPILSVPRLSKKKPKWLNLWGTEVQTHRNFQCVFFYHDTFYEYWEFCETHCHSPLVQM